MFLVCCLLCGEFAAVAFCCCGILWVEAFVVWRLVLSVFIWLVWPVVVIAYDGLAVVVYLFVMGDCVAALFCCVCWLLIWLRFWVGGVWGLDSLRVLCGFNSVDVLGCIRFLLLFGCCAL